MSKCYASAVIAVAVGEIGYLEKKTNSQLDDPTANAGSNDWTKYAAFFDQECPNWYNGKKNGYAWCDMFVDYCFHKAYGHEDALRLLCQPEKSAGAGCTYSLAYYKQKGQLHTKDPKPGDQIFFGTSTSKVSHTGIVEKVVGSIVHTIEGNTSNKVARRTYALTDSTIVGYGRPAYDVEAGGSTTPPAPSAAKTTAQLVEEVLAGKWGNGADRKSRLTAAGYDCAAVQAAVNAKLSGQSSAAIVKGSTVKLQQGAKTYTGGSLASYVYSRTYTVIQVSGDRAVIGINGVVTAAVNIQDLTLVG